MNQLKPKPEPRDGKNCKHFFTGVQRKAKDFQDIRNGILDGLLTRPLESEVGMVWRFTFAKFYLSIRTVAGTMFGQTVIRTYAHFDFF
jgi:hypothetical protein